MDATPPVVAVRSIIDPEDYEDFEGFRETTLAVFTDPKVNATLRNLGDLLYTLGLEYSRHWPREPEGSFHHQARAAVADLRHMQGFLAYLDQEREQSALTDEEVRVSRLCARLVPKVKAVADALERALGPLPVDVVVEEL